MAESGVGGGGGGSGFGFGFGTGDTGGGVTSLAAAPEKQASRVFQLYQLDSIFFLSRHICGLLFLYPMQY